MGISNQIDRTSLWLTAKLTEVTELTYPQPPCQLLWHAGICYMLNHTTNMQPVIITSSIK